MKAAVYCWSNRGEGHMASLLLLVYTAANLDWCWDMLSKPVASASMIMRPCQTSSSTRKIWHTENHYIYNTGRNMSKIGLKIGHLRYICFILKAQMDSNTVDMSWHTFTKWEKCMKCKKSVCVKKLHFSWKHAIKWKHTNSSNYIKENPKTVSVHYLERAPRPQFQS